MYTLEGVSSVASLITAYDESQINQDSHFLSVLCSSFRRLSFRFLLVTHTEPQV